MAIGINAIEISSRPLMEHLESGDVQTWLIDLISKNWETVAAGGLFFVLIGTDVVAISRDVLADGEVDLRDKEDLAALGRGFLRIVVSTGGIVGTLELGAFQIDPEAWMIANVGLAAVAVTRPSQFIDLVEKTRNFIGGK